MHLLLSVLGVLLVCVIASPILSAVHELGHVFAGRLVGMDWEFIEISRLRITRNGKRWRFSEGKCWDGGFVKPQKTWIRFTRLKSCVFYSGGPVASALFGAILIGYAATLSPHGQYPLIAVVLRIVGFASLFVGLGNLIPARLPGRGLPSDGLHLVNLLKQRQQFQEYYARWDTCQILRQLVESANQGVRPRDWDENLVTQAMALSEGSPVRASAAHLAFHWAADKGDWDAAGQFIGQAMELREKQPDPARVGIVLDAAFYHGLHLRDGNQARGYLAEAAQIAPQTPEGEQVRRFVRLRAEAAALLAERKTVDAERVAREAMAAFALSPTQPAGDEYLLKYLLTRCSEAAVQA